MTSWDTTFDLSDYEDSGWARVYPGKYLLKIVRSKYEKAGDNNNAEYDRIVLTLESATGAFKGQVRDYLSKSPKARFKTVDLVKAIENVPTIDTDRLDLSSDYLDGQVVAAPIAPNPHNDRLYFRVGSYFPANQLPTEAEGAGDLPSDFSDEDVIREYVN